VWGFVRWPVFLSMTLPTLLRGQRSASESLFGKELHRHGAVLVRDSGITSDSEFETWLAAGAIQLLEYDYGSTPRSRVTRRVYTSTEYPAHQSIPQHNEMAYTDRWPGRLWFFCAQAADRGGATPLCDARDVLRRIDPGIRKRFEERGVLYVRNYNLGVDLTWQQAFATESRDVVESRARKLGISLEWSDGDVLTTRQVAQATTSHPITGEDVWFNQAHLFHVSAHPPAIREALEGAFGVDQLPRNAYYGDGRTIEDSVLDEIRGIYKDLSTRFDWCAGDVVVIDNVLITHGRDPFEGERRVLVAMSDLQTRRSSAA